MGFGQSRVEVIRGHDEDPPQPEGGNSEAGDRSEVQEGDAQEEHLVNGHYVEEHEGPDREVRRADGQQLGKNDQGGDQEGSDEGRVKKTQKTETDDEDPVPPVAAGEEIIVLVEGREPAEENDVSEKEPLRRTEIQFVPG